jgi:flagellar FliL protein
MAEQAKQAKGQEEAPPAEAKKSPGKLVLAVVVVVGLGGGAALGMTTLGDTVGPVLAARASAGGGGDDHGGGGGGHGAEPATSAIHVVDNLVVNPARSGGTRFLLTSVAVEAPSPELVETVRARDVEIRAALILVLGAKSTEELSDIANRGVIAAEIHDAVVAVLGPELVHQVLIPQFVIQ